jgi:hypothetical protein
MKTALAVVGAVVVMAGALWAWRLYRFAQALNEW